MCSDKGTAGDRSMGAAGHIGGRVASRFAQRVGAGSLPMCREEAFERRGLSGCCRGRQPKRWCSRQTK